MPTQAELESSLSTYLGDLEKIHAIVHGDSGDVDVDTEGGPVSPFAKAIYELEQAYAAAGALRGLFAIKTAQTVRASTTAITVDPDLQILTALPVGSYEVEVSFSSFFSVAGSFKWAFLTSGVIATGASNVGHWLIGNEATSGNKSVASFTNGMAATGLTGATYHHLIKGIVKLTTSGTIGFGWAQNVSHVDSSTIYEGSLTIRKIP